MSRWSEKELFELNKYTWDNYLDINVYFSIFRELAFTIFYRLSYASKFSEPASLQEKSHNISGE